MAEMVLAPMLRAHQDADTERIASLNNPTLSRRRFVATQLYAMYVITLLCITLIIVTLVKLDQVQNYLFGNCTTSAIQYNPNEPLLNQLMSLNLTCA